MRILRLTSWLAAFLCCTASSARAQRQDTEYELVSHDGKPAAEALFTDGILLLRGNGRFVWRVTIKRGTRMAALVDSGSYRITGGRFSMVPEGGERRPSEFPAPGPDGLLRIPDGDAEGSVYRPVGASEPWRGEGRYQAVRMNGMPLPAQRRGLQMRCRTLELSGGRYRLELWYGEEDRPSRISVGEGRYDARGQELDIFPDDPALAGENPTYRWHRKPDGTLRLTSFEGTTWEFRPDADATCAPAP